MRTLLRAQRSRLLLAVRVIGTAVLVSLAAWQLDLTAVAGAFDDLDPAAAGAGTAILLAGQAISGLRWRTVAGRFGLRSTRAWFTRAYLHACFYNSFLPTGIGGDATRVLLARHLGSPAAAARSVAIDRIGGLAALTVTVGVLLPLAGFGLSPALVIAGLSAAVLVTLGATAVLLHRGLGSWLGWTLVYEFIWFAGVWLLALSLGIDLSPLAVPAVVLVVGVAVALPISIGGTGAREGAFVLALAPLGVAAAPAVALGIVFGIALALVGLCGALMPLDRGVVPVGSTA